MIRLYSSQTSDRGVQGFVEALSMNIGRPVQLLPLSQLPAPDPDRRQRLQMELVEVKQDLCGIEFLQEQYRSGQLGPDAGHESGLEFDRQALLNRRAAINRILK